MLIVGNPDRTVGDALRECNVAICRFCGRDIGSVLGSTSDDWRSVIPASVCRRVDADARTCAVTATALTRADVEPRLVDALVRDGLAHLDALASEAPILTGLHPSRMTPEGLTAPMHEAARGAFDAFVGGEAAGQ